MNSRRLVNSCPPQIIEINRTDKAGRIGHAPQKPILPSNRYIAVAGNIGAGKSSLVDFLCQRYDITPYFEPNEANPYLEDFYGDMERWSFHSQMYFLAAKFRLHQELEAQRVDLIQDRTIWEDAEIFAENLFRQGTMSQRDYRTYRQLYEGIRAQLRAPDLLIYLRCDVSAVKRRIAIRGRNMEQNIPTAYLKQLHGLYEGWLERYTLSPIVIIPTDTMDYLTDLVDQHDILTTFEKYLRGDMPEERVELELER